MSRKTPAQRVAAADAIDLIAQQLEALDRAPFRRMLAEVLGVKPTRAALAKFANKSPDRWAQALAILAQLSGYERGVLKLELTSIQGMSDIELMRQAAEAGLTFDITPVALPEAEKSVAVPSSPEGPVDVEFTEVEGPPRSGESTPTESSQFENQERKPAEESRDGS